MYVSEIAYEPLPHFPVLSQRCLYFTFSHPKKVAEAMAAWFESTQALALVDWWFLVWARR